MAFAN